MREATVPRCSPRPMVPPWASKQGAMKSTTGPDPAGGSYGAFGDNWAASLQSPVDRLGGWLCLHLHPGFRLMYDALAWDAAHFPAAYLRQLKAAVG